jgi:hypothetical protein
MTISSRTQTQAATLARKALATAISALLCVNLLPAKDIPPSPPMPACKRSDNDCAALGVYAGSLQRQAAVAKYEMESQVPTLASEAEYRRSRGEFAREDALEQKIKDLKDDAAKFAKAADDAMKNFHACLRLPPCSGEVTKPQTSGPTLESCPLARERMDSANRYREDAKKERQWAAEYRASGDNVDADRMENMAKFNEGNAKSWEEYAAYELSVCNDKLTSPPVPPGKKREPITVFDQTHMGLTPQPAPPPPPPPTSGPEEKPAAPPVKDEGQAPPPPSTTPEEKPAAPPQKSNSQSGAPDSPKQTIGIVVPADVTPGEQISGSVVTDPEKYQNIPGIKVISATVPASSDGSIGGLVVDNGDGKKQPGDKPFVIATSVGVATATLLISLLNHPSQPVAAPVIPVQPAETPLPAPSTTTYTTPAVTDSRVTQIQGPIPGNTTAMRATVDGEPARVLASKPGAVYLDTSKAVTAGAHELKLYPSPNAEPVAMTTHVINTQAVTGATTLHKGQSTTVDFTLKGLPESTSGHVLLSVVNQTPGVLKMSGAHGNQTEITLGPRDISKGTASASVKLTAVGSGTFTLSYKVKAEFEPVSVKAPGKASVADRQINQRVLRPVEPQ